MKKIEPDGSRTLYVGGIYEVDKSPDGSVTGTKTYYPAAGAMRDGSTLYYVLKDHASTWLSTSLGSASVVTDANGVIVGEDRFYPFGETRFTTGTMFTDKLFTGQRQIAELGIYHYGARFYSPKLGRFLSADTIVPGYANPQNLNRFSYVLNNPLRYIDPTGHKACEYYEGSCVSENQVTKMNKAKQEKKKSKKKDDIDWIQVANDLNKEAQRIRDDLSTQFWESAISEAMTTAGGYAVGSALKCPGPKHLCAAGGALAGFVSGFFLETQLAALMEADATAYEETASSILDGVSANGSELEVTVAHYPELTIGGGIPSYPGLNDQTITIPEHYIVSFEGGGQQKLLAHQFNFLTMIAKSKLGP